MKSGHCSFGCNFDFAVGGFIGNVDDGGPCFTSCYHLHYAQFLKSMYNLKNEVSVMTTEFTASPIQTMGFSTK